MHQATFTDLKTTLSCARICFYFVVAFLALSARGAAQETANPATVPDPNNPIVGTWNGIYYEFPELVTVKLTITSLPMDHIEGECEMKPSVQAYFNNTGTELHYSFKGHYTPWATELNVVPDKLIGTRQLGTLQELTGLYDPASDQIVGEVGPKRSGNGVYFVLARDERGDKLVEQIVAAANPPVRGGGDPRRNGMFPRPPGPASPKFRAPSAETIATWASRLKTEKPDIDLRHTYINILYILAHNLFEDDHFRKFFGDTYDKLNSDQRDAVAKVFRDSKSRQTLFEYSWLVGAFTPTGSNCSSDIAMSLFWQRGMRSWMRDRMARFGKMPPTQDTLILLNSFESMAGTELKALWPSDLMEYNKAIADARARTANVLLNQQFDQAMAAATDLAGARNLVAWLQAPTQGELFKYAPKESKDEMAAKIDRRVDELIEQPLNEKTRSIATLGQGIEAVTNGNKWYGELTKEFTFASTRPAFQKALKQLQARREADLAAAVSKIGPEIAAQENISAVENKMKSYLAVPGDEQTKPAAELRSAREKRVAEIKANEYLEYFSPNERKWNPQRDGTINPPSDVPPPDRDDVRMAIVRTFEILGGERTAPYTVRLYQNPIARLMKAYVAVDVGQVNAVSCQPDGGGYVCSYRVSSQHHMNNDYLPSGDPLTGVMQGLMSVADLPQQIEKERFELGSHGWWSPGMRDRIKEAAHKQNEQLIQNYNDSLK